MRRLLLLGLLAAGCDAPTVPPIGTPADDLPTLLSTTYDPDQTGTLQGRVVWTGPRPEVPAFARLSSAPEGRVATGSFPNPHRPDIRPDGSVAGAVVVLRGIDLNRSVPWSADPVTVELKDRHLHLRQGTTPVRVGVVRRGDSITLISAEPQPHALEADGANFFAITLPEAGQPRQRRLGRAGPVELSSTAGAFWMKAHVIVSDHPYVAVTDATGQFRFDHVPAGPCEVVVWHPNWQIRRKERDPDTGLVLRHIHQPPAEHAEPLTIHAGDTHDLMLPLDSHDFATGGTGE